MAFPSETAAEVNARIAAAANGTPGNPTVITLAKRVIATTTAVTIPLGKKYIKLLGASGGTKIVMERYRYATWGRGGGGASALTIGTISGVLPSVDTRGTAYLGEKGAPTTYAEGATAITMAAAVSVPNGWYVIEFPATGRGRRSKDEKLYSYLVKVTGQTGTDVTISDATSNNLNIPVGSMALPRPITISTNAYDYPRFHQLNTGNSIDPCEGIEIVNIGIVGNVQRATNNFIDAVYVDGLTITNPYIRNCGGHGIQTNWCNDVKITGMDVDKLGPYGIDGTASTYGGSFRHTVRSAVRDSIFGEHCNHLGITWTLGCAHAEGTNLTGAAPNLVDNHAGDVYKSTFTNCISTSPTTGMNFGNVTLSRGVDGMVVDNCRARHPGLMGARNTTFKKLTVTGLLDVNSLYDNNEDTDPDDGTGGPITSDPWVSTVGTPVEDATKRFIADTVDNHRPSDAFPGSGADSIYGGLKNVVFGSDDPVDACNFNNALSGYNRPVIDFWSAGLKNQKYGSVTFKNCNFTQSNDGAAGKGDTPARSGSLPTIAITQASPGVANVFNFENCTFTRAQIAVDAESASTTAAFISVCSRSLFNTAGVTNLTGTTTINLTDCHFVHLNQNAFGVKAVRGQTTAIADPTKIVVNIIGAANTMKGAQDATPRALAITDFANVYEEPA